MAQYKDESVVIENTRLLFRNLSGAKGKYNKEGVRSFAVVLENKMADDLIARGWNVKWLEPREEGDVAVPYLPVKVNYEGPRPPRIILVTSKGRNTLEEKDLSLVDWANIMFVDLIVNPYKWDYDGETGISAYLKNMFVTIEEDYLDIKYADLEEAQRMDGSPEE